MSGRRLLVFALVTVTVIIAAFAASRFRAPHETADKPLLFPGLAAQANDVAELRIQGKGRKLTLKKQGEGWVMAEADGYPAKFQRVRETVVGVAGLRVASNKTSNPELFDRLGVEDPASPGANSTLLSLLDREGKALAELVVGKNRLSAASGGGAGLYVRKPDAQQALLVEGKLDVSVESREWFERDLFDIRSDRVSEVVVDHGDGKPLHVRRAQAGGEFAIAGMPEGKESRSPVMVTRIGTLLENFFVDGVRSESKVIFPATPIRTTVKTSDGLIAVIDAAMVEERPMVKMSFAYEAPPAAEATPPAAPAPDAAAAVQEPAAGGAAETPAEADAVEEPAPDVPAEAARLQKAVAGWVFEIPDFKYELFSRRLDDLIRDPAEKSEEPPVPAELPSPE